MRLRKKNVSRVAAVAVAAVMAVSAAAPAAVAAAPVANGDTAAVQEASKRGICINYYNEDTGKFIQTGYVEVEDDDVYLSTSLLKDVPNGFTVAPSCPTIAVGRDVISTDVYCVPAPATQDVEVVFYDFQNGKTAGKQYFQLPADQTTIAASELTLPPNYEFASEESSYVIRGGYVNVDVVEKAATPATQDVEVVFYDYKNKETAGKQNLTLSADKTSVAASELKLPDDYEFETEKSSYDILNGYVNVAVVKKAVAPATQDVEVVFYDFQNGKTAGKQKLTLSADKTSVAASELKLPDGYEFETEKPSYKILNGYVNVAVVEKTVAPATQDVEVVFYDFQNSETAGKQNLTLSADKTSVAASELKLPDGYEFETEKASYDILNGYVNVAVVKKAVATTKVVKINFYSEDEEKQIEESELTVAADATYVNSSKLTAPKGYELCEVGDFAIRDGYVYAAVRKATTKVVKINFYSEDEEKQIEEPELTVAADATYVNSSALTAPEGYELCEVGDFAIRDGYVYVAVRKVTTPDPVDPTPTPAAPISPVASAIGLGTCLLILGGLILGFLGL